VPELHRLGRTLSRWRAEILAYHDTRRSNGPTEAINLLEPGHTFSIQERSREARAVLAAASSEHPTWS